MQLISDEEMRWGKVAGRAGRNEAAAIFVQTAFLGVITPLVARSAFPHVWCSAEWPAMIAQPDVWEEVFGVILEEGQYIVEEQATGYSLPFSSLGTDPLKLYRGATAAGGRGMSWTSDKDRAVWFAKRFETTSQAIGRDELRPTLFTAEVDPHTVVACIDKRNESEYVLRPSALRSSSFEIAATVLD